MVKPKLIVITDWAIEGLEQKLARLRPLGEQVAIQHRAPDMAPEEFLRKARALVKLGLPLFINGQVDVAVTVGAHLHLPDGGPTASRCRARLPDKLISVAVHTASAEVTGADLALVSPVFTPGSKPDDRRPPLGPEGFARIAASLPCPSYALGGIGPQNIGQIPDAAGAAVISSVLKAADPLVAARALLAALAGRS